MTLFFKWVCTQSVCHARCLAWIDDTRYWQASRELYTKNKDDLYLDRVTNYLLATWSSYISWSLILGSQSTEAITNCVIKRWSTTDGLSVHLCLFDCEAKLLRLSLSAFWHVCGKQVKHDRPAALLITVTQTNWFKHVGRLKTSHTRLKTTSCLLQYVKDYLHHLQDVIAALTFMPRAYTMTHTCWWRSMGSCSASTAWMAVRHSAMALWIIACV